MCSISLVIGTRHQDRGSVITPLITSISVSGTLSKLLWLLLVSRCPAEMISPWKWVQVPHQLHLVRDKDLNGICTLSVVTYTVILFHCNSLGAPGAADILCAGDWASDWSCLHHSPRRSCPTRTQGLIIYPFIHSGFRFRTPFCLNYLWLNPSSDSSLKTPSPRWLSCPVTSIHLSWRQWGSPPSSMTTSSRWTSWTRPRPSRSQPCRCSTLLRKAGEIQRYLEVTVLILVVKRSKGQMSSSCSCEHPTGILLH